MKNTMFIFALLSTFLFSFSPSLHAQQTVGQRMRSNSTVNQDWQSLRNNRMIQSTPQQVRPRAVVPQQRRIAPQQNRVVAPPRQVYVPRQQPAQVYLVPQTYSAPAQSAYIPQPNFSDATNQALSDAYRLMGESKKMMQDAMPEVQRRQQEYQNASPQRRMQMDAEKQYMLEMGRINMEGFYNDRWVRSFNPSAPVIYVREH